jgi:hypothetical protein
MLVSEDQLDEFNKTESDDRIKACQDNEEMSSPLMNGIEDNNIASEVTSTVMNGIGDNNSAPEVANPVTNENEDNEASVVMYPMINGNEDDKVPEVFFETMGVCKAERISPDKGEVQTIHTPGYSRISSLTKFSRGQCSRFL